MCDVSVTFLLCLYMTNVRRTMLCRDVPAAMERRLSFTCDVSTAILRCNHCVQISSGQCNTVLLGRSN